MSTADVIRLAPWPSAARKWTQYELAIVQEHLFRGMQSAAPGGTPDAALVAEAFAVTSAIASAPSCFRAVFGPAPAVPVTFFNCVGSKYIRSGALNPPAARARFVADIVSGSLCETSSYFSGCESYLPPGAISGAVGLMPDYTGLPPMSGAQQNTRFAAPPNADAELRTRTQYILTTGRQALAMLQSALQVTAQQGVSIQLPPVLQQMIQLANSAPAAMFMDRQVYIAATVRPGALQDPAFQAEALQIASVLGPIIVGGLTVGQGFTVPADMTQRLYSLALRVFEDLVLIWAPNQGASILPFLNGTGNLAGLLGMMTTFGIDPNALGGILANLPPQLQTAISTQLPAIAQQLQGLLGGLFGGVHGIDDRAASASLFRAPSLPPPPLPRGISAVTVQRGEADAAGGGSTGDKAPPSPLLIGSIAVGAALVVAMLLMSGGKDESAG